MQTTERGTPRAAYIDDILSIIGKSRGDSGKNKVSVSCLPVKLRKEAMGFVKNVGLCGTCGHFEWLEVGSKNRCKAGGFANASRHGCKYYQHE
ncbi:MAG TPA: hypothetical protein VH280_16405 [Verrucomicrobiae bacterium]|nr:hypothetical protein [Verrucomicrobiae bacterium]